MFACEDVFEDGLEPELDTGPHISTNPEIEDRTIENEGSTFSCEDV